MSTKGKAYRNGNHWRAWQHEMPWLDKRQARRARRRALTATLQPCKSDHR